MLCKMRLLATMVALSSCAPMFQKTGSTTASVVMRPTIQTSVIRPTTKTVRVDQNDNGSSVSLRVGDTLVVNLPTNFSTGLRWSPNFPINGSVLQQIETSAYNSSSAWSGRDAVMVFRALAKGNATISLSYIKPFSEPSVNAKTFKLSIFVR